MPPGGPATIICALEHERRVLRRSPMLRALRAAGAVTFLTSGPGEAARACVESLDDEQRHGAVVLVGVAGAVRESIGSGTAATVSLVVDADGDQVWTPPLRRPGHDIVVTSAPTILDASAKRRLAGRCPADLVDLESVPFARAATAAGVTWGIVRGVSDGPDDSLPAGADRWVGPDGRTNLAAVAAALARRPSLAPELLRLGRRTRLALGSAAGQVAALLGPASRR